MTAPRLAIFMSHPTQMEAPLFRKLSQEFSLKVFYWKTATLHQLLDPELGHAPGWDFPLTGGYDCEVIPSNGFLHRNLRKSEPFRTNNYDAVLVNGYGFREALLTIFSAARKGIPVIVRSDTTMLYKRNRWKEHIRDPIIRLLFSRISAFMATGSMAKSYLLHYGVPEEKIFRFPYAVDNDRFYRESELHRANRNKLRSQMGIPDHATVFLAVIKFIQREGCFPLIEAFSSIAITEPAAWLVVVGDGPERSKLQTRFSTASLSQIIFSGYQPYSALPKFYAIADAFIHPALEEPWGVSVNEAMACGLPVIASDKVGSAYDLVRDGENGFIYEADDPTRLAACLQRYLNHSNSCAAMGIRSKEMIQDWGFALCRNELQKALAYVKRRHG